jgi:hypothetical protein
MFSPVHSPRQCCLCTQEPFSPCLILCVKGLGLVLTGVNHLLNPREGQDMWLFGLSRGWVTETSSSSRSDGGTGWWVWWGCYGIVACLLVDWEPGEECDPSHSKECWWHLGWWVWWGTCFLAGVFCLLVDWVRPLMLQRGAPNSNHSHLLSSTYPSC